MAFDKVHLIKLGITNRNNTSSLLRLGKTNKVVSAYFKDEKIYFKSMGEQFKFNDQW